MDKLRRSLSFRKRKNKVPEASKPHQWQEDEKKVRDGTCSFQVRYLGCLEVFESRGMQVCEEAIKALKSQCKGKYQRAVLYVSGDALRVVDEISKGLIVDQTIEKVSFCAPDRNHEKGFAYICRDGTTRRWMCHGFMAVKESGERLSHAVGCAFAICLERKQKRDRETGVSVHYSDDKTTFTRFGSFRQASLTERREDPQSAILAEPPPVSPVAEDPPESPLPLEPADSPGGGAQPGRQRPKASQEMMIRQGSFRQFSKLNEQGGGAFKKQLSLQVNQVPSNIERLRANYKPEPGSNVPVYEGDVIEEASPTTESADSKPPTKRPELAHQDSITAMCQQLTQGLTALTSTDPFGSESTGPPPAVPVRDDSVPVTNGSRAGAPSAATLAQTQLPPPVRESIPWNQTAHPQLPQGAGGNTPPVNGTSDPFGPGPQFSKTTPNRAPLTNRSVSMESGGGFNDGKGGRPTLSELAKKQHSFQVSNWAGQPYADPFDAAWAAKATQRPGYVPATPPSAGSNVSNPFSPGGQGDTITQTFQAQV